MGFHERLRARSALDRFGVRALPPSVPRDLSWFVRLENLEMWTLRRAVEGADPEAPESIALRRMIERGVDV